MHLLLLKLVPDPMCALRIALWPTAYHVCLMCSASFQILHQTADKLLEGVSEADLHDRLK